jgi:hypothetical protein
VVGEQRSRVRGGSSSAVTISDQALCSLGCTMLLVPDSFAKMSWLMNEHSSASPNGPPVYHFKALIPITGVLMLLQGFAETARCVICIFTGQWPQRLHDVEELENVILGEVKERGIDETIRDLEHKGSKA